MTQLMADEALDFNVDIGQQSMKQLKNKIDGMKKTGKKLVEKYVLPILGKAESGTSTGAAVDNEEDRQATNPLETIHWEKLHQRARWQHLKRYFKLFGDHPTLGGSLAPTADTAPSSDAETSKSNGEDSDDRGMGVGEVGGEESEESQG